MIENPALFAAIIANPCEDTPRLAYADWLDESGDTDRARFIRLQHEIEKLPPIGPKASKAKKEEAALLEKHEKEWAGEIAELAALCRFRRGFVEFVRVTAAGFLKHGNRLFELAPIREVLFDQIGDRMPALVESPHFGRAETLGFSSYILDQIGDNGRLELLLGCPHLATVRRLDLSMGRLNDKDAERIAACPNLGALVHLDLSWNSVFVAGIRALVASERLPALTSLTINANRQVGAYAVEALVGSPLADRLRHLSLANHEFWNEPVKLIASAPRLKGLRTLDLSDNGITDAGAVALAESPYLTELERLTLRGHRKTLGANGREALKKRFGKDACVF